MKQAIRNIRTYAMIGLATLACYLLYILAHGGGKGFNTIFYTLVLFFSSLIVYGIYLFWKEFQKNGLFVAHGMAFLIVVLILALQIFNNLLGLELLQQGQYARRQFAWFLMLAAFLILAAPLYARGRKTRLSESDGKAPPVSIWPFYLFCALYPVQHFVASNPEVFSYLKIAQFAAIALILPTLLFVSLRFYLKPFLEPRKFILLNYAAALLVFLMYMRPVISELSIGLSKLIGISVNVYALILALFVSLLLAVYKFRNSVNSFLLILGSLVIINLIYVLITSREIQGSNNEKTPIEQTRLARKPNIYILVVDGYLNKKGLLAKKIENLDIGNTLNEKGFKVYADAFSNYNPSVQAMTGFFDFAHHHYNIPSDWVLTMTGSNKMYSILKANGYQTKIIHPFDLLVQGNCQSDYCSPAPAVFGQFSFILAQTIFYNKGFYKNMKLGTRAHTINLQRIIREQESPTVIYSHVLLPSHGPRGCSDHQSQIDKYAHRLAEANTYISAMVEEIIDTDPNGLIIVTGDHGAMLTNNCTWTDPDVTSRDTVIDNLGVLMAVKWPVDYDNSYDGNIHSLMDLSWYLFQFLSGGGFEESQKPSSSSYLRSGGKVYKVIQDGMILDEPEEYKPPRLPQSE